MLLTCKDRDDWLDYRRRYIGSSDAAVLWGCGYSSQSLYSLWCEKRHGLQWEPTKSEAIRLRRGQAMEPVIRELAAEELGVELSTDPPHSLRTLGILAASLDSHFSDETHDGSPTIPVECKDVGRHNAHEWADGGYPLKYEPQLRHQMAVVEAPYGYLVGLCDDELVIRRIERDLTIEAEHKRRCEEFWDRVQSGNHPPIDGSDATTGALRSLYRRERTPAKDGPAEIDEWTREIERLSEEIKEREKERESLRNRLRSEIGDAEGIVSPSGVEWRWTTVERKEHTVAASSSRQLKRVGGRKK